MSTETTKLTQELAAKAKADATSIKKAIGSIASRSTKLQADIHNTALAAMAHCQTYGNATLVLDLYVALPNGQRRKALVKWVHAFSPIRVLDRKSDKDGPKVGVQKQDAKTFTPFNLDDAATTPYYDYMTEEQVSQFTVGEFDLSSILQKRYDRLIEGQVRGVVGIKYLEELKAVTSAATTLGIELTDSTEVIKAKVDTQLAA